MKDVTTDTFQQEVLESDVPVLVDFWSQGCGPCRMMVSVLNEMEGDVPFKIVKVDVGESYELGSKYGVSAVPTFVAFNNGEVVGKTIGVQSKEGLSGLFNE